MKTYYLVLAAVLPTGLKVWRFHMDLGSDPRELPSNMEREAFAWRCAAACGVGRADLLDRDGGHNLMLQICETNAEAAVAYQAVMRGEMALSKDSVAVEIKSFGGVTPS